MEIFFVFVFVLYNTLHNIQHTTHTTQKLSAWRKNHPSVPGAGVWPEDQKRHRGRRKKRPRRYREVLLPERSSKRKIVRKFVVKSRQNVPPKSPSSESRRKVSTYPYHRHHRRKKNRREKKNKIKKIKKKHKTNKKKNKKTRVNPRQRGSWGKYIAQYCRQ